MQLKQAGSVDRSLRESVDLRLQNERTEGLFILGEILAEDIPKGFGLLRAEEHGLVVADGDLLGRLALCQAEDELEVPHADADLDAVGIGLAVVGSLGELDLRLLRIGIHDEPRVSRCAERSDKNPRRRHFGVPWSVREITSFCDGRHSAQPFNPVILSPWLIASSTMEVSIPNDSVRKNNYLGSGLLPEK